MSDKQLHRHDLTDEQRKILEPILSGQGGQWVGVAKDNRLFMNGVLWILRTGAPWRDLPREFGVYISDFVDGETRASGAHFKRIRQCLFVLSIAILRNLL